MSGIVRYNKVMDKLAYHYNKKEIPAETAGKTIYNQFNQNKAKENSLDPSGFKWVALGGESEGDA